MLYAEYAATKNIQFIGELNMRFVCRCGNMLTNQLDSNDTEYYVYSDS